MFRTEVVVLDIIALLLTAVWVLLSIVKGLSTNELLFNYLYSGIVMLAFILTLADGIGGND